jgi:hypothetical protein
VLSGKVLDVQALDDGSKELQHARKSVSNDKYWPDAGAPPVDFIARLPTASLHPERQP